MADDIGELKVVQLRAELEARSLPTDGTKADLIVRLREAVSGTLASAKRARLDGEDKGPRASLANGGNHEADGDSDDSDVGPALPANYAPNAAVDEMQDAVASGDNVGDTITASLEKSAARALKRPRRLEHESAYLDALPSAAMYERSYMHRAQLTATLVTPAGSDFIVTGSADGVIKFWKKIPGEIEFAKSYRAHLGAVLCLVASTDGTRLASVGEDRTVKFFDVSNFDMTDWTTLTFAPAAATWISPRGDARALLAVSDRHTPAIYVYNADTPTAPPSATLHAHTAPVLVLAYNEAAATVISADAKGVIEYWSADPTGGFGLPSPAAGLQFELKSETDLYDVAKARAYPQSLTISPFGRTFAVTATDRRVRLFNFVTGKLARVYDEGLHVYEAAMAENKLGLDSLDFGRRAAVERDMISATTAAIRAFVAPPTAATMQSGTSSAPAGSDSGSTSAVQHSKGKSGAGARATAATAAAALPPLIPASNAVFDESGALMMYPCLLGIKVVNTVTNSVARVLGRVEASERFLALALYQGVPTISSQYALARDAAAGKSASVMSLLPGGGGGGEGSLSAKAVSEADPLIVAAAFRGNRFYCFSRREPAEMLTTAVDGGAMLNSTGRDVFNEPPSKEDLAVAAEASSAITRARLGGEAIVHTSRGDVFVTLMPDIAPKAVENFCTHSRNGYFNGHIFHRVIKNFMIQTGDPTGTGTGGTSIWGREFDDEIVRTVRFDRPFCVAMANAGPGTNGSQWFITTEPTPWLDGKHTIFGRVTRGFDVVKDIESAKTGGKFDRPLEDISIVSVDIKQ